MASTDFAGFTGMDPTDPIRVTVEVDASTGRVWDAISAPGNLTRVHPFCADNEVERWPGPGSRDRIRYHSGIVYRREAVEWSEGSGYVMAVGPAAGATALATWEIHERPDGRADFGIEVVAFVRESVGAEARAGYVGEVVEGALPSYVDNVVRGVRHFVESGEPVGRNRFGPHAIFSPA